jgi:hypothetical protein
VSFRYSDLLVDVVAANGCPDPSRPACPPPSKPQCPAPSKKGGKKAPRQDLAVLKAQLRQSLDGAPALL